MKEREPWKDLPFYTTIDLTTRFWMLPKDSRAYRNTLHDIDISRTVTNNKLLIYYTPHQSKSRSKITVSK